MELLVLTTISFFISLIACVVLSAKILGEVGDAGAAAGSANQSYNAGETEEDEPEPFGRAAITPTWGVGSFQDTVDFCDQSASCGVRFCTAPSPEVPPP